MKSLFAILVISLSTLTCMAQKDPVYSTRSGAIQGYDPVAYFKESKSIKGSESYSYNWQGADWYFSSEENKSVFKENPEAYAPQFGGYCSYAVSQGYTAKIDPEAWRIVDNKLYLNYNKSVQKKWEGNREEFIKLANKNWPEVLEK